MNYLIDLDGTLMDGSKPQRGARSLLERLRREDVPFLVMTNSIKSPAAVRDRLAAADIRIDERAIVNPIRAINVFLRSHGIGKAFVIGSDAERAQVDAVHGEAGAEAVVLLDFEKDDVSYSTLQRAFALAQRGVPLLAASGSAFYRKDDGLWLDTGAFVRLLESAIGAAIPVMGKPSPEYFALALALLGARSEDAMVVGDDWSTDVAGAKAAGCKAALVRSGKYRPGDEGRCRPDLVIDSLEALLQ